ncbi:septal ring lytic transglycosylase RlpA family protein [Aurantimonas sp. A2-1-M11]|uniref:septal ring lytic transglycosylase RlpA family protein n=1 Tax=Aurantimonas sp. A2-1-M11 TaxID=3113712 RepID=UPI002F944FEA
MAGCTGAQSPVEELADISTTVKFDSRTFGVPASPRVTTAKRVPKGGGRSQVGKPYKVRGKWYYPKDDPGYSKTGTASWYGPNFHGRLTANGEVYDMHGLSAAHKTFPLPSYAMVTNLENGSRVMVRVNDRGPFAHGREIDLSAVAADLLDFQNAGTAEVKVDYVGRAPLEGDDTQMLMASYEPAPGSEPYGDTIMVASAEGAIGPQRGIGASVTAYGAQAGLPGVRPMVGESEGRGAGSGQGFDLRRLLPLDGLSSFTSSYAPVPSGGGAGDALSAAIDAEPERIAIGTIAGDLAARVRSVVLGHGRLVEDGVPGEAGLAATLVVDRDVDTDALLRRLWQVGAEDAFVVRD